MGPRVYDARIRPSGVNATGDITAKMQNITFRNFSDAPTFVTVNIFVRSFSKIDDVKMVSFQLSIWTTKLNYFCSFQFNLFFKALTKLIKTTF